MLFLGLLLFIAGCNNSELALKNLDFEKNKAKLYNIVKHNILIDENIEYVLYEKEKLQIKYLNNDILNIDKSNSEAENFIHLLNDLDIFIVYKYEKYYQLNLHSSCNILKYNIEGNALDIKNLEEIGKWYRKLDNNWLFKKSECYGFE